jgi:catalase
VEQVAFSPSALVPGIEPSEDKLLQGRLFSYPDTQRYRLGANYLQIPVNCPYASVSNHQRDGAMQMKQEVIPINYEPNRFTDSPKESPEVTETTPAIQGNIGRIKISKTNDFAQAGDRYRNFSESERANLIANLANDLKNVQEHTRLLAICNFYRADEEYGSRVAEALNINLAQFLAAPTQS